MKAAIDYAKIKTAVEGDLLIKTKDGLKPVQVGELIYNDQRLYDIIEEYEQLKVLEQEIIIKLKFKNYPTDNVHYAVKWAELTDYNKLKMRKALKNKLKEINL